MKLIDKTVVVEEINRVLNSYHPTEITSGRYALAHLRDFINTLEVKDVNFEDVYMVDREIAREKSILDETKVEYFATGFDAGANWMKKQIIRIVSSLDY